MKFYVLITLSKRSIAFNYYRDDSDGHAIRPFDGLCPAPLAVYSHGSAMEIGENALKAAKRGSEGAFTNIFELAQQEGTFDFNGNRYPYNKLLFHAIEFALRHFLKSTLFNISGDLETNRATMNISLNFGPDMEDKDKLYVRQLLKDGGYGNVHELDYNRMAVDALKDSFSKPNVLIVNSDGEDLYCRLYDRESLAPRSSAVSCLAGCGKDPRLDRVINKIKEDIAEENPWADFDASMNLISAAAQSFLDSNRTSINANLQLSDGNRYSYYLTRTGLDSIATNDHNFRTELKSAMDVLNVDPSLTAVILKGNTCNQYFRTQFGYLFNQISEIKGTVDEKVRTRIIQHLESQTDDRSPAVTPSKQKTIPEPIQPTSLPNVDMRVWNRKKREILAEAKGKARMPNYNYTGAVDILKQFMLEAHQAGVSDFDVELNPFLAEWQSKVKVVETKRQDPQKQNENTVDTFQTGSESREKIKKARVTLADANSKRRGGNPTAAVAILRKLEFELHRSNIHDLDEKISQALKECGSLASETVESKPKSTATTSASAAQKLLEQGKFVEAKRAFAQEGNSEMVKISTQLIRHKRDLDNYSAQLSTASKATAEGIITRLKAIKEIYRQANLDTSKIDKLINSYKNKGK